jgi:mannitol/fructose-specific phosphotransferase system IIA component (Ntr-type)
MRLADFLAPSRVLLPLACETLDSARGALLERLAASGAVADLERLQSRVAEERGEDMVAIADRAFLLHFRTDTAASLQVAIGVCRDGIRRSIEENVEQRAPVVVMVVGPPRSAARQLQVVRAFSRLLAKEEVIAALLDAPSAESIVTLPMFAEYEIPE